MTALAPARVGWCPGALAPMASGDGLILRIKPLGGRLSLDQARTVTRVSASCGNGALDLTGRANIQIRGLTEEQLADATGPLDRAGLLDADTGAEAVRNIVSSPLAGIDPGAMFDIRPAVEALEARLVNDKALHVLPAKFSFVVDDGGWFGLATLAADIRFEAFWSETGPAFAVRLGGGEDEATGCCGPGEIGHVAAALARIFLLERKDRGDLRRMRDLVKILSASAILRRTGLDVLEPPRPIEPGSPSFGAVGLVAHHGTDTSNPRQVFGIGAPFGRLSAEQLQKLVGSAREGGATELRLTPWRSILVPGLDPAAASALAETCAGAGLITEPQDSRLRISACTGAPGCHRGSTPVLDHAAELASRLDRDDLGLNRSESVSVTGPGDMKHDVDQKPVPAFRRQAFSASRSEAEILVHVSGCSKGCAHPGKAPLVLVAQDGAYDAVVDGTASDSPVLRRLTFTQALAWVQRSTRMEARA